MSKKNYCPLIEDKELLTKGCKSCREGDKYNCLSQAEHNVLGGIRFGLPGILYKEGKLKMTGKNKTRMSEEDRLRIKTLKKMNKLETSQPSTIGLENEFNRLLTSEKYVEANKLLIKHPRVIGKFRGDDLAYYYQLFKKEIPGYNPNPLASLIHKVTTGEGK